MAKVFILTGKRKGENLNLHDRYSFKDGVMIVNDDNQAENARALMDFYGAKMVTLEEYEAAVKAKGDPNKDKTSAVSAAEAAVAPPHKQPK